MNVVSAAAPTRRSSGGRFRTGVAAVRDATDRIGTYLPVLLMALLALGTYWLVRSAPPVSSGTKTVAPLRHEPDYFMRNFTVRTFDPDGTLRRELSGVEGRHYPDTDTLEIEKPRIRAFSDTHSEVVATAERALSNGDGSEVQLFDNAVVTRAAERSSAGKITPQLQFRGDFLDVFTNTERVSSNRPVILTRGKDRFTADAMDYDNLTQVANLRGRVRGQMFPQVADSTQLPAPATSSKAAPRRKP